MKIQNLLLFNDGKGENVDGASRSIAELWELTKSRFPATSMKAMVKILF
jgi:hypothetical protein